MDLTLLLTHDCNLRCTYCYGGRKRRQAMPWSVAEAALDLAFARPHRAPRMTLGFFGGEPLLEWDLLRRATEAAERRARRLRVELRPTVTTNASLLTAERVAWLAEHRFHLGVSLDGDRPTHDRCRRFRNGRSSHAACLAGLERALPAFPRLEVVLVVTPRNVRGLAAGVAFLADEVGVARVALNPDFPARWTRAALEGWRRAYGAVADLVVRRYRAGAPLAVNVIDAKVITRLKDGFECRDRCDFGEREVAVAPSGRLYPCERVVGEDREPSELCLGDVDRGFDRARRSAILARRGNVNPECGSCSIRARCMNWCCCVNYALTGAIDRTDGVVCFHERLAVEVADRVGATLYADANPAFLARFYGDPPPGPAGAVAQDPAPVVSS